MEFGSSIVEFLENKSILVTGATGYLGKVFIEKILRVQPNVKKLYLLLRAKNTESAEQRFHTEIIAKELFKVIKEKLGQNWSSILSENITIVAGDICYNDLGVKDSSLLDEMWRQVDVVVNLAATTKFDERYDVALGINTSGAKNVVNFSKKCSKLKMLLHVSTAYVSGEKEGLILETPCKIGESLNGKPGLDIDAEFNLVRDSLEQMKAANHSEDHIKSSMKDLGIQRAREYGWPNTYSLTKAMGEMLLGELKENLPLVIIRPTIVTSTYKEPFPGWIEGIKTIDSFLAGYCTGRLNFFLCGSQTILDMIPVDMVVNAMIVAMVAHSNQPNETIYHIGSSVTNPFRLLLFHEYAYQYFTKHPWFDKDGKPVTVGKFKVLNTMDSFRRYMDLRYTLPLKGLKILNDVCCQNFLGIYLDRCKKVQLVTRMMELYRPYVLFKGCFDDKNSEKLRRAAKESGVETDTFYHDPRIIKWEEYFLNVHFPGVVEYTIKRLS